METQAITMAARATVPLSNQDGSDQVVAHLQQTPDSFDLLATTKMMPLIRQLESLSVEMDSELDQNYVMTVTLQLVMDVRPTDLVLTPTGSVMAEATHQMTLASNET